MDTLRVLVPQHMQELLTLPEFISIEQALYLIGQETRFGYIGLCRVLNPKHEHYDELRLCEAIKKSDIVPD